MDADLSYHAVTFIDRARTYHAVLLGIVAWDWLTSLKAEYRYIWKAPWSLTKILYLIARYVCLSLVIVIIIFYFRSTTLVQCRYLLRLSCVSLMLIQIVSLTVLTERAYLVSQKNRIVLGVMAFCIFAVLVTGSLHAAISMRPQAAAFSDGEGLCVNAGTRNSLVLSLLFLGFPIVGVSFATAVVVHQALKHLHNVSRLRRLLVIDGLVYLAGVHCIGIVQFGFTAASKARGNLSTLNEAALLSLTAVLCCRLILHCKRHAVKSTPSSPWKTTRPFRSYSDPAFWRGDLIASPASQPSRPGFEIEFMSMQQSLELATESKPAPIQELHCEKT